MPYAELLELVDWADLGSVVERRVGSSPTFSTIILSRRQAVRHQTLTLACTGSNPVGTAIWSSTQEAVRGRPAKALGRATDARVRIPPAPPEPITPMLTVVSAPRLVFWKNRKSQVLYGRDDESG